MRALSRRRLSARAGAMARAEPALHPGKSCIRRGRCLMAATHPPVQQAGAAPLAPKPPGSARRLDALVAVAAVLVIAGAILDVSQRPMSAAWLPLVIAVATLAALAALWFGLQHLRRTTERQQVAVEAQRMESERDQQAILRLLDEL